MTISLTTVKEKQQKVWSAGDYALIGNPLVIMGELLCEAVDLRAGEKVLDVATGSGNAAISAARRNARVTGLDYVPELLEQARRRAAAERVEVAFEEGDAEALPYPDAAFDVVLSTVGVMFTADQEKAAGELLRVCRPGGRIGLANWTPDGFVGGMLRTVVRHVPPPAGLKPPVLWGTEGRLEELFGGKVARLEARRRSFVFRHPSEEYFIRHFRAYYGPVRKAFEALDADGQDALARDLRGLLESWNTAGDGTLVVPSDYLEVVISKA